MTPRQTPSGATDSTAPETSPQVTNEDALHASFYATFDPEPEMAWVVPFLDPDALGDAGEEDDR